MTSIYSKGTLHWETKDSGVESIVITIVDVSERRTKKIEEVLKKVKVKTLQKWLINKRDHVNESKTEIVGTEEHYQKTDQRSKGQK